MRTSTPLFLATISVATFAGGLAAYADDCFVSRDCDAAEVSCQAVSDTRCERTVHVTSIPSFTPAIGPGVKYITADHYCAARYYTNKQSFETCGTLNLTECDTWFAWIGNKQILTCLPPGGGDPP